MRKYTTAKYTTALSVAVALQVFCYFVIFATAYPSAELLRAIAFEVAIFVVVLAFKLKQNRSKAARIENLVLDELGSQWQILGFMRRAGNAFVLVCWLSVVLFLAIDLTALTAAWLGNSALARTLYMGHYNLARNAYTSAAGLDKMAAIPTVHPAYSLEILTGAYAEASKYERALQLSQDLKEMRQELFGKESELYAGALADEANIYHKQGKFEKAEVIGKEALAISRRVLKNSGMGQIITQTADNLRDQGKYKEAEGLYGEALQMRQKQFGPGSVKVAETLVEYAKLLRLMAAKSAEARAVNLNQALLARAQAYQERADSIFKRHETKSDPLASMLVTIVVFFASILISKILVGPQGYLTKMALRRMEQRLNQQKDTSSSRENIGKLIKFYENQNNIEQVEKYQNLLASIGKD
ncbi:hypothetical protein BH11CYA1_BH11CYA1_21170 [soil metagenome]